MNGRRGFTLIELAVAAALLAALLATSVQMLRALSIHQRGVSRHEIALEAIQAIAEQVTNLPWDQLTPENASQIKVPAVLDKMLPGSKLAIHVSDERAPVTSKQIMIELSWVNPNGEVSAQVRLTAWAFPENKER